MKNITLLSLALMLTGCASMPELFKSVEEIATDDCVKISVDKDAFVNHPDLHIEIDLKNPEK